MVVSLPILPRMRNISGRSAEEIKAHQKLFFENRAVYEIMSKNIVEQDSPQMTIWSMRFASLIPKATNTRS
jgi:hypothetical protein